MANFERRGESVRARFMHNGRLYTKTFREQALAESWARRMKRTLLNREAIAMGQLLSQMPQRVLKAIAAAEYSAEDIEGGAVPAEVSSGIYFLLKHGSIVYVGKTKDVFLRLSKHRRDGKDFDAYNFIPCAIEDLAEMEAIYIAALAPKLNSTY